MFRHKPRLSRPRGLREAMNCYTDSDARQPRSLALRLTLPSVPQALLAGVVTDHPLPARATETAVLEVPGLVLGAIFPVTRHRALLTSFAWACGAPALAFSPLGSGMPPNGLERQIPVPCPLVAPRTLNAVSGPRGSIRGIRSGPQSRV